MCRCLGTLKNGEQKSFPVDDYSRQVFLILNRRNANKYHFAVTIPAGTENVFLAGQFYSQATTAVFRFEGGYQTPEQQTREAARQKRQSRITIIAIAVGIILAAALSYMSSQLAGKVDPKTFSYQDFSITLTEDFVQCSYDNTDVAFESDEVAVFASRDDKGYFGNISLKDYAQMAIQASGRADTQLHQEGARIWITYTARIDGMEYFYMVQFYESEDAFWLVNFATPIGFREKYENQFMKWADSVIVARTAAA